MYDTADELIEKAEAALEKRSALAEERNALAADTKLTSTQKDSRAKELDKEIRALGVEARGHVEAAELRSIHERAARLTGVGHAGLDQNGNRKAPMEWRAGIPTPQEWRALTAEGTPSAGGYAVPQGVSQMYVDHLRAQSVVQRAPGLNIVRFDTASFVLPELTASTGAAVFGEGVSITEGTLTFAGLTLSPVKYAARYSASAEIIDDASVDVHTLIANTMIKDVAAQVDKDALTGAGGATALRGVTDATNGTTTTYTAGQGHTAITWDDIVTAAGTIMGTGANPTVVWCSVDTWVSLMKQKASTAGSYLAGGPTDNPANVAWGLPLLPTTSLAVRTAIVADASRVYLGVRNEVRLAQDLSYGFDRDITSYRLTYRVAGVKSAETSSIQVLIAPAT
jgi:HK97 family phage major capsid protein